MGCTYGGRRSGTKVKRDGSARYFLGLEVGEFGIASDVGIVACRMPGNPLSCCNRKPGVLISWHSNHIDHLARAVVISYTMSNQDLS